MKQFILGVAVGVVADRLATGNLSVGKVTNEDVLGEIRKHLKTIDEKLAEKQADSVDVPVTPEPTEPTGP